MKKLTVLLALVAATWLGPACAQTSFAERGGSFAARVDYAVGNLPYAVTVADFNGDGKLDLATGNYNSNSVSVLLGGGNGSFLAATSYPTGNGSEGVAAADFNGDGKIDIAVANLLSSTVSILLGNGVGGFAAADNYGVGTNPHTVVAADFNSDGKLDLASADGSQGSVSMLIGSGTGSFLPSVQIPTGCINPRDLVAADFDGNGKFDVALTCQGATNIVVLLGNGSGGFGAPATVAVGTEPFGITTGKFDAGSTVDLAVSLIGSDKVAILLGNGSGGFSPGADLTSLYRARAAKAFDVDGDGKQDLVSVTENNLVSVSMGAGNGGFSAPTAFPVQAPSGLAQGDFNGDGKPDLALADSQGNALSILINNSSPPLNIAPSPTVENGSSYTTRKAAIWVNRQTSGTYPAGFPYSHTGYADLDRDGDTDFIRTFSDNNQLFPLQVMINDGAGNFSDQTATRIVGPQPGLRTSRKVLTGDYNGDGWPDVLVLGHGIDAPPFPGEYPQLFLSNGNGTLTYDPGLESQVGFHHGGASADIDGNGTIDVFTNAEQPYFLLNDGNGHFTPNTSRVPRTPSGAQFRPIASELIDVDGDGFIDLVADGYEPNGTSNAIYWGSSSGLYLYSNRSVLAPVPDMGVTLDFAVEDIDHDGRRDVVVVRTGSTNLYVGRYIQILRQTSARVFVDQTAARIVFNPALLPLDYIRAQDFNGDGFVDLFIDDKNDVASGQYAWINNGQGVFTPYGGAINLPGDSRISVSDVATSEGDGGSKLVNFAIDLSGPTSRAVTFDVYTAPGTASPGVDYASNAAVGVSIAPGQTSAIFPVAVNGDAEVEGHETFTVNLANVVNARIGNGQGQGKIINDDLAQLSVQDASVVEGNAGSTTVSFVVQLSQPMPNPVTFDIATSNGSAIAGSDYLARSQLGRYLDAGRTRQLFEVSIKGDALPEANESFNVTIGNVVGAALGDGVALGTIVDDDTAAAPAALRTRTGPLHRLGRRLPANP